MSKASCCCGFSPSAAAGRNVTRRIDARAAQKAIRKLRCDLTRLRPTAANISPSKMPPSPANGSNIFGCNRVLVFIAEMGPHIIHNGSHLVVVHHRAERRHSALTVDDDPDGIATGYKIAVAGQRWIRSGSRGTFAVGHVATPADIGEQFLATSFDKPVARAQSGLRHRTPGALRTCR